MSIRICCTLIVGILLTSATRAQAPYQKNPQIPEFSLLAADSSTWITQKTFKSGKPVMIVLFSPDCDHCIKFTEELKKESAKFSGVEILMTTYQPIFKMKEFSKKFGLGAYNNIYLGRDVRYFFGPFFQLKSTPFVALYNAEHKLLNAYDGGAPIEKLLATLKSK